MIKWPCRTIPVRRLISARPTLCIAPLVPVISSSGLNARGASFKMTIEKCTYCNREDDPASELPLIMTRHRLRPRTLAVASALNVRLPACMKCFNMAQSGVSPNGKLRPSKMVMLEAEKMTRGIKRRLSGNNITIAGRELDRADAICAQYDAVWLSIQQHLDFIAHSPPAAQRHSRNVIANDINDMNAAARYLSSIRNRIGRVITLEYDEARRAANAFIRKEWVRNFVMERDGFRCVLCPSIDTLCIDHIRPVCRGGESTLDNLQTLCRSCNSIKADKI